MNDVKLIEQVKLYEELYNSADKNYNNHPHKEKIWFKIGKVMNTPAFVCKARWISIRDQYRKAMKKKRLMGAAKRCRWRLEEEMSFLYPLFRRYSPRQTKPAEVESTYDHKLQLQVPEQELSNEGLEDYASTSSFGDARADAEDSKTSLLNERKDYDALDLFFGTICATVKQFSKYNQSIAKSRIFSVVSEMEMKQLMDEESQKGSEEEDEGSTNDQNVIDITQIKIEEFENEKILKNLAEESRDCD